MRYIVAIAGGMKRKTGGTLTLEDFLPQSIKPEPKQLDEAALKARLMAMAQTTRN